MVKRARSDVLSAVPMKRVLRPAPPKIVQEEERRSTTFYDLPPELRIEIYKLVLEKVTLHILPSKSSTDQSPHPLVQTSRQVRNEVLPILHAACPIKSTVTDFNFDGMLAWMSRMPPDQEANLCKNQSLSIELVTTVNDKKDQSSNSMKNSQSLRKWLHVRADRYRPQPGWKYKGAAPDSKTAYEMKRRTKRAAKEDEKRELNMMLKALNVKPLSPTVQQPSPDSSTAGD